jgi:transcriptional regulator with XRE-family HTH domain
MIFGERIRELRRRKDLTLRGLAAKVGFGFTYISKIENGKLATKAVGIGGRSRLTTLQHTTLALRNALSPTLDPVEP